MQTVTAEVVRAFSLHLGLPEDLISIAVQRMGIEITGEMNDRKNE